MRTRFEKISDALKFRISAARVIFLSRKKCVLTIETVTHRAKKAKCVVLLSFYGYKCSKKKFVLWRKNSNKAYVIFFVFSFIYLGKKDTTWGETLCGLSPHWICTNGRKENTFGGNSKLSFTDPDHPNHPIRIGRTRGKFLKGGFVLLFFMGLITGLPCWTFC